MPFDYVHINNGCSVVCYGEYNVLYEDVEQIHNIMISNVFHDFACKYIYIYIYICCANRDLTRFMLMYDRSHVCFVS